MNTTVTLSPNGVDIYQLDSEPTELLVGTLDGVIALQREAEATRWHFVKQKLKGHHVSSLMIDPIHNAVFAGTHGSGLHRSADGINNWEPVMRGISSPHIFTLAYDRRGESITLYAGTEPAMLFRSIDGGDHWKELSALRDVPGAEGWNFPPPPHIAHLKHVVADPRAADTLYVCVEQGALLKSKDGGQTFDELLFEDDACVLNKDVHRIVFDPNDPDRIYVDGGDGIFTSDNAGENWSRIADTRQPVGYPDQLFVDPDNPEIIVVFGGGNPPNLWRTTGEVRSTIMRSGDGGDTWRTFTNGLSAPFDGNLEAATMVRWPDGYGFFTGTTDGEIFASLDKGENWTKIADDVTPLSKCVHFSLIARGRAVAAAAEYLPR